MRAGGTVDLAAVMATEAVRRSSRRRPVPGRRWQTRRAGVLLVCRYRQQLQQAALSGGDQDSKVKQMEVEVESLSSQLEVGEQEFKQVLEVVHDLQRAAALRKVYQLFDIDCKGQVGEAELMEIGQVRQQLSQQGGEWTAEDNRALLSTIGLDAQGQALLLCCV